MMTTMATVMVLLAISCFLKRQGHIDSGDQIHTLMETYSPMPDGKQPATVEGEPHIAE